MNLVSRIIAHVSRLQAARRNPLDMLRGINVAMPYGAQLLTDRYSPRGLERPPVVLIRTPYGKDAYVAATVVQPLAEQDFRVVMQGCRGAHGSGGAFNPYHGERADGLATIEWIKSQSWYGGAIATFAASYLPHTSGRLRPMPTLR